MRWLPIGPRTGGKIDRLAYFALLGLIVSRLPHDLLVEDFSAPFSVGLSPLFTRRPVVASVQWMFARQMRAKYGLPFDWVERVGLRPATTTSSPCPVARAVDSVRPPTRGYCRHPEWRARGGI